MAIFRKADVWIYVKWLDAYVDRGGKVTHYYDREFNSEQWLMAVENFELFGECGANSRRIVAISGVTFSGPLGHNDVYSYSTDGSPNVSENGIVPAFSDPVFLSIPGVVELRREVLQRKRLREVNRSLRRRPMRDWLTE